MTARVIDVKACRYVCECKLILTLSVASLMALSIDSCLLSEVLEMRINIDKQQSIFTGLNYVGINLKCTIIPINDRHLLSENIHRHGSMAEQHANTILYHRQRRCGRLGLE